MKNLANVTQTLRQELQQLVDRADQFENRLRQPGDEDWAEQATQRENDEVLESLHQQTLQEIEQIKQALHRIEQGSYGNCARCGKQIAAERLEILPYATTCTECA